MATAQSGKNEESSSSTIVVETEDTETADVPSVRMKLKKPKSEKKVGWTEDTVDNENMGKKKSKCCCIYEKPREFDESSSESDGDGECDHCKGHTEKKKHSKPTEIQNQIDKDTKDK